MKPLSGIDTTKRGPVFRHINAQPRRNNETARLPITLRLQEGKRTGNTSHSEVDVLEIPGLCRGEGAMRDHADALHIGFGDLNGSVGIHLLHHSDVAVDPEAPS